jgi:hypothetical protein
VQTVAKRQIDFAGPSVKDLGIDIVDEKGISNIGNTNIGNTNHGNSENGNSKNETAKIKPPFESEMNAEREVKYENGITNNGNSKSGITSKNYHTVQARMVRDYLYKALGDTERAEIKLSIMCQELGINPKTLYKHLKPLRENEFIITKLQYGTEIRKRR